MYPFLKLTATLLRAKYHPRLRLEDCGVLEYRVGLSDIDMFMELNNARYFTYMELGRWDYAVRVGLFSVLRKQKWATTVGGMSVRFRRRIPYSTRFTVTTQPLCHDDRWGYFLQEIYLGEKISSSALMKIGFTSKQGLVPAIEVLEKINRADWCPDPPDWVTKWIQAESQRPWPGV